MQILCFLSFSSRAAVSVVFPPCCPVQVLSFALWLDHVFLSEQIKMRWDELPYPAPLATHSATRRDSFIDFGAIYYLLTYLPTNRTHLQYVARITVSCRPSSWIDRETGRQQSAVRRTSGSLLQRYMGNSLWWLLWWHRRQSRLLQSRLRVSQLLCRWITKYLAVANRSRVSCAQNTSRTSTGLITQSPWNLLKIIGKRNHWIDHNTTYC